MNIIITGEGGQGVQTIAETLAYAATLQGKYASYLPEFGVEQRGTPSTAYVIINDKEFVENKFKMADIAVVLRERALVSIQDKINPNTTLIFDNSTIDHKAIPRHSGKLKAIPATKIAFTELQPKVFNTIILGAVAKLIGLNKISIWKALEKYLGRKFIKNPTIKNDNKKALEIGLSFEFITSNFTQPEYSICQKDVVTKDFDKVSTVIPSMCKGCGICILKCPVKAISFSDQIGYFGNVIPKIDNEKCILCGNCSLFCPDTAIIVEK